MESYYERIKTLRIKAGLTQQAVADAIGITRTGYQMIENGCNGKKFGYLPTIAKTFGCHIDDLFPEMDDIKTASVVGFDDESLDDFEL